MQLLDTDDIADMALLLAVAQRTEVELDKQRKALASEIVRTLAQAMK